MSYTYQQQQRFNTTVFRNLTPAQQHELRQLGYNNRGKENVARSHQLITDYANRITEESYAALQANTNKLCQDVMDAMEHTDAVVATLQKGYVAKNNIVPVTVARLGLTGGKLVLPRDPRPLKDFHCPIDTIVPIKVIRLHGENIIYRRWV